MKAYYKKLPNGKLSCNKSMHPLKEFDLVIDAKDMPETHLDFLSLVDGELIESKEEFEAYKEKERNKVDLISYMRNLKNEDQLKIISHFESILNNGETS